MKKIVTIGGGTGSYAVLTGLKHFDFDITAIVTMFDSGGSSGVLRDEMGILPPGDIRRCIVALADDQQQAVLRDLFNYRFEKESSLQGHSFGNLFLAALASIYGSDIAAIKKASELLNLRGRVLPVSLDSSHLRAVLEDGTVVIGETNIDVPQHDGKLRISSLSLEPRATIYDETSQAIRDADIIVIGPGDIYTSVIPNLLVDGINEALQASSAKKVFVCNLMTKWGETHGYSASDLASDVLRYSGLSTFDHIICNTEPMDQKLVTAYEAEKKHPVICDPGLASHTQNLITGDFFSESDIARHDPEKLAKIITSL